MRRSAVFQLALVSCMLCGIARGEDIQWFRDFDSGMKRARETRKPVLVDFWAIWCKPCQVMDQQVYRDARVVEASSRFVFIQVDVDKDKNTPFRYRANVIPTVVILDPWETTLLFRQGFAQVNELLEMMKPVPATFDPIVENMEAVAKNKNDYEALAGIGQFYRQSGFFVIAREFFGRALKTPRAAEDRWARDHVRLALGLLALKAGDVKEAEKIFEKACKDCDPRLEPDMLMGLGMAYFRKGRTREARGVFEKVVERFPDSAYTRVARENLAQMGK